MGLSKHRINGLRVAARTHDIGKMYIPAEILSKPTTLSELEMEKVRTHPQIGYDILRGANYVWPVAEIVLQHHERMDGSGYPQGLMEGEIRLESRILAVADVFEAMVSPRLHRPAHDRDTALEELRQHKKCLYEPAAVDACMELVNEKGFTFE
jgi:HD-GYP domain-containing protein (c-di-GMP phosphodiesterase class II)